MQCLTDIDFKGHLNFVTSLMHKYVFLCDFLRHFSEVLPVFSLHSMIRSFTWLLFSAKLSCFPLSVIFKSFSLQEIETKLTRLIGKQNQTKPHISVQTVFYRRSGKSTCPYLFIFCHHTIFFLFLLEQFVPYIVPCMFFRYYSHLDLGCSSEVSDTSLKWSLWRFYEEFTMSFVLCRNTPSKCRIKLHSSCMDFIIHEQNSVRIWIITYSSASWQTKCTILYQDHSIKHEEYLQVTTLR